VSRKIRVASDAGILIHSMSESSATFRVGLTPDFPIEAAGRYEADVADKFDGVADLNY
jgi:hypothetical protein